MLLVTQSALAVVALVLGLLDVTGVVQYWQVLVLATALGVITALDTPVRQSFVVEMVGRDELTNAVAINSTIFNTGRILGPAIAGVLISAVGTGWAFIGNAASSLAVLTGLLLMRTAELHPGAAAAPRPRPAARGLALRARRAATSMLTMVLIFVIGTFGLNFAITCALMAKQVFHQGASGYGLLSTALAVGAFCGAVRRPGARKRPSPLFLLGMAAVFSVAEVVAGLMPTSADRDRARPHRPGHAVGHHRGQRPRPARRRADHARPGDVALPRLLPGRHAARRADRRLARRCRRAALGAHRRRRGLPALRGGLAAASARQRGLHVGDVAELVTTRVRAAA